MNKTPLLLFGLCFVILPLLPFNKAKDGDQPLSKTDGVVLVGMALLAVSLAIKRKDEE